jgi:hypothetical protein
MMKIEIRIDDVGMMGVPLGELIKKPLITKKKRKKASKIDKAIKPKVGAKKMWDMEQV